LCQTTKGVTNIEHQSSPAITSSNKLNSGAVLKIFYAFVVCVSSATQDRCPNRSVAKSITLQLKVKGSDLKYYSQRNLYFKLNEMDFWFLTARFYKQQKNKFGIGTHFGKVN
jgi:hypothetical protein